MLHRTFFILAILISFSSFSQNNCEVLLWIDDESIYLSEFLDVYEKNKNIDSDSEVFESIEDYLTLFIHYKLKVNEAQELGIDTLPKFLNELKTYKQKLLEPFFKEDSLKEKLLSKYEISVDEKALNQFESSDWKNNSRNFNSILLKINGHKISQINYINFVKEKQIEHSKNSFELFKTNAIMEYYKWDIEKNDKHFVKTIKEYHNGLLLFEMLEREIWNKANDKIGLTNFYHLKKETIYNGKDIEDVKSTIISDYQVFLEEEWNKSLVEKYKIKFNEVVRQKVLEGKFD